MNITVILRNDKIRCMLLIFCGLLYADCRSSSAVKPSESLQAMSDYAESFPDLYALAQNHPARYVLNEICMKDVDQALNIIQGKYPSRPKVGDIERRLPVWRTCELVSIWDSTGLILPRHPVKFPIRIPHQRLMAT